MSKIALLAAVLIGAVFCAAGCSGIPRINAAVATGDVREVMSYADQAPTVVTATGFKVRTIDMALYVAAHQGQLALVEALVAKGADPRIPDVLEIAAQSSHVSVVRFLMEQGADPNASPVWGGTDTALTVARRNPRPEVAAAMERRTPLTASPAPRVEPSVHAPRTPVSDVDSPLKRASERPDDFALVIGIEEYQSLPKADYGVRDAQTMRKHLESLGFPARNIISLEGPQATGNKLKSYLEEWLPLNVKPASTLFVYYSGHGAPDPSTGDAYLVPWDGDATFLKSTAYPLKKFYADLSKTKAKRVFVALDACFSGAGGRSVLAQGARPLVAKVAEVSGGDRVTILAAASGEEITGSLNEQGHGMFTYFLLKGLSEGKRTAKELHEYLSPKVADEARRQNRQQTPALIGQDAPL